LKEDFVLFTVSVETYFWASHQITVADGSKEARHSHNWKITAQVGAEKINEIGLVVDFRKIKAVLESVVAEFDNRQIDKIEYFRQNNSTAENVAVYIYRQMEKKLPKDVKLEAVRVVEQSGCEAEFSE